MIEALPVLALILTDTSQASVRSDQQRLLRHLYRSSYSALQVAIWNGLYSTLE